LIRAFHRTLLILADFIRNDSDTDHPDFEAFAIPGSSHRQILEPGNRAEELKDTEISQFLSVYWRRITQKIPEPADGKALVARESELGSANGLRPVCKSHLLHLRSPLSLLQ
jgi:hypothetical protein